MEPANANGHVIDQIELAIQELDGQRHQSLLDWDTKKEKLVSALTVIRSLDSRDGEVEVAQSPIESAALHFFGVPVDLRDASNLAQRLESIAMAIGEPIDPMDATGFLIASGISKAKFRNLRPHVYNALKDHPDFDRTEDGLFRYRRLTEVTSSTS